MAERRDGGCHCGAVRFTATVDLRHPLRCNCSMCAMRGAVGVHAPMAEFTVTKGKGDLSTYRFGTMAACYYFCRNCGVYTHHQTRSHPDEFAVNVACLDGVDPYSFREVRVLDGRHHPKDEGGKWRWAGTMRFEPADEDENRPWR